MSGKGNRKIAVLTFFLVMKEFHGPFWKSHLYLGNLQEVEVTVWFSEFPPRGDFFGPPDKLNYETGCAPRRPPYRKEAPFGHPRRANVFCQGLHSANDHIDLLTRRGLRHVWEHQIRAQLVSGIAMPKRHIVVGKGSSPWHGCGLAPGKLVWRRWSLGCEAKRRWERWSDIRNRLDPV